MGSGHVLKELSQRIEKFVHKPENYLKAQNELAENVKVAVKNLYDYTKSVERIPRGDALPELIIEDFDEEQIWQQLELQNEAVFSKHLDDIAYFAARKSRFQLPLAKENFTKKKDSENSLENCDNDARVLLERDEGDDVDGNDTLSSSEGEEDEDGKEARSAKASQEGARRQKPSVVDDKFFKLGQMEEFLENEDRKEISHSHISSMKRTGSDSDDEESVDYFEDIPTEDTDDEESALKAKYEDFFDEPDVDAQRSEKKNASHETNGQLKTKNVRFNLSSEEENANVDLKEPSEDETKSGKDSRYESVFVSEKAVLSSLERRKSRIDEKVAQLEQQALSDKPWQLQGEVGAETRPHNSLLEEAVEFDSATRPAPVRTEKTTMKLEDIIKQRIKDRAWDDVERKQKPVESPHEYRKRLILDQEKSKMSLAEVYEQEYLKQKEKLANDAAGGQEKPDEELAEHLEIRTLMTTLFSKLDALSNFHYTPKMAAPEVKVVTNLPAVSVEEVAPAATSDATLLAPEEVKSKSHGSDIVSTAEKTATDRKRERRHKKMAQKMRARRRMEKEKAAGILVRGSNVSKLEDCGADRAIKSSTAFFDKLQNEVKSQIHVLTAVKRSTDAVSNLFSAKKLKL